MKLISTKSKFLPIILLAMLLISILFAFSKAHNTIIAMGQNPSVWFIIFTLLPAIFGIILYSLLGISKGKISTLEADIKSLKSALEATLKTETKEVNPEEKEVKIDFSQIVSQVLPNFEPTNLEKYSETLLGNIAKKFDIVQGLYYNKNIESGIFSFTSGYAFFSESQPASYVEGDTLPGQVAKNKQVLNLNNVPEGYINILSGLGKGSPKHLLIIPVINSNNETFGIMELASFKPFNPQHEELFTVLGRKLGEVLASFKPISQD